jgi:hypothetical protein
MMLCLIEEIFLSYKLNQQLPCKYSSHLCGFQQLCEVILLDEIFAYPQSDIPTIFSVVKHYSEYNLKKKVLMQNFTSSGTKKFQIPGSLPEED